MQAHELIPGETYLVGNEYAEFLRINCDGTARFRRLNSPTGDFTVTPDAVKGKKAWCCDVPKMLREIADSVKKAHACPKCGAQDEHEVCEIDLGVIEDKLLEIARRLSGG